ncbi:MAG: tRNA uridine-5-carboxymethylaminomethyl(34) synthesis GTPase MnmE [Flavobacteriales bacterium]|nr:tRNA uridine-5-carboxymethylaminomethyl(34) synthesis GTPase MnmE [Flavobacteriales bacterium]
MNYFNNEDTICAIATGSSMSAIAIIRISGPQAIEITNSIFSKNILQQKTHTIHFGNIIEKEKIIDEVLISIFKDGKSYTGEETIEISCHGSVYITKKIMQILINKGCRSANAGEFTMRAFKNGKIDLSQAESVADLIASENKSSHQTAINQLRGGFSNQLQNLRAQLIEFASLVELELDFAEEDVEFADKNKFKKLLIKIKKELESLINSFKLGNAIKNGIPVAIVGAPNSGKSTLLNTLLNEEKAIVSEIEGTTRDAIEDSINIEGTQFRFIDTAGIRKTENIIEKIGIDIALENAKKSNIVLHVIDAKSNILKELNNFKKIEKNISGKIITVVNKIDLIKKNKEKLNDAIYISAKNKIGINSLKQNLLSSINTNKLFNDDTIITNLRHYDELKLSLVEIDTIIKGVEKNLSGDLLAFNIRQSLYHLGSITGEITNDTLLSNIFGKFCIGK